MRINEIFYSIQGEGYYSGRPAVFVRFSGCNLKCPFCDTAFQSFTEMKESEVVEAVEKANTGGCRFVVLTGGEPTMQLTHSLVEKLHDRGYYIAMESNGAFRDGNEFEVDWLTVSPKNPYFEAETPLKSHSADEVKVIVDDNINASVMKLYEGFFDAKHFYLQPCDTGDELKNREIINKTIELLKENPKWTLSLQTQKLLGVR